MPGIALPNILIIALECFPQKTEVLTLALVFKRVWQVFEDRQRIIHGGLLRFAPHAVDGGFDLVFEYADQLFVGVDQALLCFDLGDDSALGVEIRERDFSFKYYGLGN